MPAFAPPLSSRPAASLGSPAGRPPSAAAPASPLAAAGAAPGAQLPAAALSNSAVTLENQLRRQREPAKAPQRPRPISATHLL